MTEPGVGETTITLNALPVFSRPGLQIYAVIINMVMGLSAGAFLGGTVGFLLPGAVAGAILGVTLGIAAARKLGGAGTPQSVTIDATHLRMLFPKQKIVSVPLEEVRSIEERGKDRRRVLVIGTERRPFVFPWAAFGTGMPELLRDAVRAAVGLRPRGSELVAAMDRREQLGRELIRRRPRVAAVLVLCVCVAFGLEVATGALRSPAMLLSFGGNAPVLVADGQWWRLATANLLHASWLHFGLNYFALVLLGVLLERLVGTWQVLAISLVAGITGNLASALASTHVYSLGVSSILFGMIGALLVVNWRSRSALPAGFHIGWTRWVVLLGINGLITLLPVVDGWAHLGGLIGGAAAAFVLVPKDLDVGRTRVAAGVIGALLAIGYVSSVSAALLNASKGDARADYLHAALDNGWLSAESLNAATWLLAIDSTTRPVELARIERATTRLVERNPHDAHYRDTHAYVLYRNGHLGEAIEQERTALIDAGSSPPSSTLYTMFFRFVADRGHVIPDATVRFEGGQAIIESAIPGAMIFAGTPQRGFVRVVLPEGTREARVSAPQWIGDDDLPVWLVDGSGPEPRTSTVQIGFAHGDATTARLP